MALLAYNRCSMRPGYMNFRSSGRVLSPQWYKSATTWLRSGNESCKTKAIASFLCSPSVYFSSPVVSYYSRNSMSDQYIFQSSFMQAAFLAWNICSRKFLLTESCLALLHLLAAHSCFQWRIWNTQARCWLKFASSQQGLHLKLSL